MYIALDGTWEAILEDGTTARVKLPGTLDENGVGHRDTASSCWHPDAQLGNAGGDFAADAPIATRFTRKHTFEGEARFTRSVRLATPEGKRIFLEAERARALRLLVDGEEIAPVYPANISTPYVFELTGIADGEHIVTLLSDNSYPGMPREAIVSSSAATDETQTNWNGVLGYLRLRTEENVFLSDVAVYPWDGQLKVVAQIEAGEAFEGELCLESEALGETARIQASGQKGHCQVTALLPLAQTVRYWEEGDGQLYLMKATLCMGKRKAYREVSFGVRSFGDNGKGRLALNGRTIFLRGEANCCVFPEEGHAPMSVEGWLGVLGRYRAYGVNCMRFHSYCPPEAAFIAADRMGMLMQPELSHWNPKDAFETEESFRYYRDELSQLLRFLANHPSFVMLTFGNELQASQLGHERMDELLRLARQTDPTRLYANGSNVHYGERGCDAGSDFYTSCQGNPDAPLRGTFSEMEGYINREYPSAKHGYDASMEQIRKTYRKPVFSFEVGQFEVLPDFDELDSFHGVCEPVNLALIRDRVRQRGLEDRWKRYVEATGELALIGYREEVEAAMRTHGLSGISLLGLQDFPGQGTALVGMMNSHLEPKPYAFASPERFRRFFRESLPLVLLEKYTYEAGEMLRAEVIVANFGRQQLQGELRWELAAEAGETCKEGSLGQLCCPAGEYTSAGTLELSLAFVRGARALRLRVSMGELANEYPVWVYPAVKPVCPENVHETRVLDETAQEVLRAGGCVYLSPDSDKEHLPHSIQAQFTTDFWSVGTFAGQEGGMGQLIEAEHPVFRGFPTEFHTDWQWWAMASGRAVILPRLLDCIVTEMDSYAFLRPMAQLFECRCLGGRVLFSSMGLHRLQQYPEARALQASIYAYLSDGSLFTQRQELTVQELQDMVR